MSLFVKMRKIFKTARFLIRMLKKSNRILFPTRLTQKQIKTRTQKLKMTTIAILKDSSNQSVSVNAPFSRSSEQLPFGADSTQVSSETTVRLSSGIRLTMRPERSECQKRHLMTTCTCFAWGANTTSPSRRAGTTRLASCAPSSIRRSRERNKQQGSLSN